MVFTRKDGNFSANMLVYRAGYHDIVSEIGDCIETKCLQKLLKVGELRIHVTSGSQKSRKKT